LVFFLFDLLFLDGEDLRGLPLVDRKARLETLLSGAPDMLRYNDHQIGRGRDFHRLACEHGLEGIVSKRITGRYESDRRTWLKTKCLNREEFVVVGWSDPESSRHRIGSLLLGCYTPDGKLIYAGRAGTGCPSPSWSACGSVFSRSRPTRCRSLSRRHAAVGSDRRGCIGWQPDMVVEVSFAEWTPDGLLRHVVYLGEREDKPAIEVRRKRCFLTSRPAVWLAAGVAIC
jgi:bifunctional non-homologous end joining protein LigD